MKKRIGVLALQGAFKEHKNILSRLGAEPFEIRSRTDLVSCHLDGIILPGGESTVMGKLLVELDMMNLLRDKIKAGLPVFGTCAGMILLSENISNDKALHLGTMKIKVQRNAYGRQLGSFSGDYEFSALGKIPMVFIRAPYIEKTGEDVLILSRVDDRIVAAREKNMLVTSFHPELTDNLLVHSYFLESVVS